MKSIMSGSWTKCSGVFDSRGPSGVGASFARWLTSFFWLPDNQTIRYAGIKSRLLAEFLYRTLTLYVASVEDRLHYNRPPRFWRSQLMDSISFASPKAIIAARTKAIESGLLHYTEGSRTTESRYWTMIPEWLESHMRRVPNRNVSKSTRSSTTTKRTGGCKEKTNRSKNGRRPQEDGKREQLIFPNSQRNKNKRNIQTSLGEERNEHGRNISTSRKIVGWVGLTGSIDA